MVDSELAAVGGEGAPWLIDVLVVNKARREGEQSERDAGAEPFQGAATLAFERELVLAGPEQRGPSTTRRLVAEARQANRRYLVEKTPRHVRKLDLILACVSAWGM